MFIWLTGRWTILAAKRSIAIQFPWGVYDLWLDGGLPPDFSERQPLQITKLALVPIFMTIYGGELPILNYFCEIQPGRPCLRKIRRKRTLVQRIFDIKTHPYGRLIPVPSTFYVPPPDAVCLQQNCPFDVNYSFPSTQKSSCSTKMLHNKNSRSDFLIRFSNPRWKI